MAMGRLDRFSRNYSPVHNPLDFFQLLFSFEHWIILCSLPVTVLMAEKALRAAQCQAKEWDSQHTSVSKCTLCRCLPFQLDNCVMTVNLQRGYRCTLLRVWHLLLYSLMSLVCSPVYISRNYTVLVYYVIEVGCWCNVIKLAMGE